MKKIAGSVTALAIVFLVTTISAKPGFSGWTFGMSKDDVKKVSNCTPYTEVASTGGLECAGFEYMGETMNISFVFKEGGLAKIQLWVYEGKELDAAATRFEKLLKHLEKLYGEVESPGVNAPASLSKDALAGKLKSLLPIANGIVKLQFKPKKDPQTAFVFGSYLHHPVHGYYVFQYFTPPKKAPAKPPQGER